MQSSTVGGVAGSPDGVGLDKAFDWEKEFPQVFEKSNGFDIIIGNPPYVKLEHIRETSETLEHIGYQTFSKRGDLYVLFVERAFQLTKENGLCSFIMPNKWLQADYGKHLRSYFLQENISRLIDFGDLQVFEGATTYPCIFISQKGKINNQIICSVLNKEYANDFEQNILKNEQTLWASDFNEQTWVISSKKDKELLEKLKNKFDTFEAVIGEAKRGLITGYNEAYFIDNTLKDLLIHKHEESKELIGKCLRGRDLSPYSTTSADNLENIILAYYGSYRILEQDYPAIYEYLNLHKDKLQNRGQCKGSKATEQKPFTGQHHWLELDNTPTFEYLKIYQESKIMYQTFQVKPCFVYDEMGLYCNNSMWIIPTKNKGLLALLNSKMSWWLISKYCTQIQNGYQLIWKHFKQIPIPPTSSILSSIAQIRIKLQEQLDIQIQKTQNFLKRKLALEKLSKKLEQWHKLTIDEFIKEISKIKKNLSIKEEAQWEAYILDELEKLQPLLKSIADTDEEINHMVYELYELNDEEIAYIERGTSN